MVAGFQNDAGTVQQEAGFGFNGLFWTESSIDGITAKSGGGRSATTPVMAAMMNRVATVAAIGDSVVLPSAIPGLQLCVFNDAALAMQVFGQGSDLVNGMAGATGVSQMGKSVAWYSCAKPAQWSVSGLGSGFAGQYPTFSTQSGITASSTQTQAAGTLITATQAQISVCAVSGNACTLMPAVAGMEITVINNGAQPCNVFPIDQARGGVSGGDSINALSQNAAFSLVASTPTIFYCFVTGLWITK